VSAPLPFHDLEKVYEALARAIDAAGEERDVIVLVKLVMAMAHECGDIGVFERALAMIAEPDPRDRRHDDTEGGDFTLSQGSTNVSSG
jgi:hypothetical protein